MTCISFIVISGIKASFEVKKNNKQTKTKRQFLYWVLTWFSLLLKEMPWMVYFTRHRVHQCAVMQNIHMLHIGLVMPICPLNLIILCAFAPPPPLLYFPPFWLSSQSFLPIIPYVLKVQGGGCIEKSFVNTFLWPLQGQREMWRKVYEDF